MTVSSTFAASDGDGYELQMGRWSRRLAPLFIDFTGVVTAECVLDVGCGTGSLSFALAANPRIDAVQGVDVASIYIEHAKSRSHDSRVGFRVGDACALPFPDASFDHSLSSLVLQFVPDPDQAIREMRRVTRPGGAVAATTWDTRGGMIIHRMFFDTASVLDPAAAELRARTCSRPISRLGGLGKAWREAGLVDVIEDSIPIRMDYRSFGDFWASLDGKDGPYSGYLGTLNADLKSTLRARVQAAYLDGDPDGPRSYAAIAWAVKGKVP